MGFHPPPVGFYEDDLDAVDPLAMSPRLWIKSSGVAGACTAGGRAEPFLIRRPPRPWGVSPLLGMPGAGPSSG
jgi:hypothetical protein